MKFLELYDSTQDKLTKRAKHIYTLLKNGVLNVWTDEEESGRKITYTLPQNVQFTTIQLKDGLVYACVELPEEGEEINYIENGEPTDFEETEELYLQVFNRFANFKVVLLDYNFWVEYPGYSYIKVISRMMGVWREDLDNEDEYEL